MSSAPATARPNVPAVTATAVARWRRKPTGLSSKQVRGAPMRTPRSSARSSNASGSAAWRHLSGPVGADQGDTRCDACTGDHGQRDDARSASSRRHARRRDLVGERGRRDERRREHAGAPQVGQSGAATGSWPWRRQRCARRPPYPASKGTKNIVNETTASYGSSLHRPWLRTARSGLVAPTKAMKSDAVGGAEQQARPSTRRPSSPGATRSATGHDASMHGRRQPSPGRMSPTS